jgi:O-antigen ligase
MANPLIDPQDDMAIFSRDDSPIRRRFLSIALVCCWLLIFVTFSAPGRDQSPVGSLDMIAIAKVAARAISLGLLTCLLLPLWNVPKRKTVQRNLLPIALFVALAIVSTLWSPLASFTLGQSASLGVLFMLAMTIGILWSSPRDTSTIVCSIATALLAVSTLLVLARLFAPALQSMSREGSGMFHATSAGATASLGMVVLISSRLLWNWRWSRVLLPGALIHAVVLLVAINRVSLFLTFLLVSFVVLRYSNRAVVLATILVMCVAATCYIAIDPGFRYIDALFGTASSYANRGQSFSDLRSLSGRSEMWLAIWESYQQSIWLGHGYSVCSPTGELFVWYERANWTAHNVLLQCLMSTGIIGFALLFGGLARIAYRWLSSYLSGRVSHELTVFLVVIGFWYALWGAFNATFLGPVTPESVAFFVVIGLAVGAMSASGVAELPPMTDEGQFMAETGWT